MQNTAIDFDQVWSRVWISTPCRRGHRGLAVAAVLLDAAKPDGLEQLELVSVLQLTCQELDGGGKAPATSSLLQNHKEPP